MERTSNCLRSCLVSPDSEMVPCQGYCNNNYHKACVGFSLEDNPDEWICEECQEIPEGYDKMNTTSQDLSQLEENVQRTNLVDNNSPALISQVQTVADVSPNIQEPQAADNLANHNDPPEDANPRQDNHVPTSLVRIQELEEQIANEPSDPEATDSPRMLAAKKSRPLRERQDGFIAPIPPAKQYRKLQTAKRSVPVVKIDVSPEPSTSKTSKPPASTPTKHSNPKRSKRPTTKTAKRSASKTTNHSTSETTEQPTCEAEEPSEADTTEYEVERIVGHQCNNDGSILYWTKWKGYPEEQNTLEFEIAFTKAYRILESYKRKAKLGKPTIENYWRHEEAWGSTYARQPNPDIWNGPRVVIRSIKG